MKYSKLKLYIAEVDVSYSVSSKGHKIHWLITHKLSLNELQKSTISYMKHKTRIVNFMPPSDFF